MNSLQLHGIIEKEVSPRDAAPVHEIVSFDAFDAVVSNYTLGPDTAKISPEILTTAAMNHHHILLTYCSDFALLPMRFGAVFSGREALCEGVCALGKTYIDALHFLSVHREYSFELTSDIAPLEQKQVHTTGRDFLSDRMHARNRKRSLSQDKRQFAEGLQAHISAIAAQPIHYRESKSGRILDLTALLSPSAVYDLGELALGAQTKAAALGLTLCIKGPWPAYHYVASRTGLGVT